MTARLEGVTRKKDKPELASSRPPGRRGPARRPVHNDRGRAVRFRERRAHRLDLLSDLRYVPPPEQVPLTLAQARKLAAVLLELPGLAERGTP